MNIINIVLKNAKNAVTYFKNNEYKDLESIVLRYVKRLNVKIRFKFSNEKKKKHTSHNCGSPVCFDISSVSKKASDQRCWLLGCVSVPAVYQWMFSYAL